MFDQLFAERGLSFDRLRVLLEVHEAGSISQAAPDDPIRQSQYSRQLRELAAFFGCEVARRQGKFLKLTPAGHRLAELARAQFHALDDFRADCRAESPCYVIGAGDSLLHWLVVPRLGALVTGRDAVRFATSNLRTRDVVQWLLEGRADFGVIRQDAVVEGLASAPLGELGYVIVVPRALARGARAPTLRDVCNRLPLALPSADGQFAQRLRAIADELGVDLVASLGCESFPQALAAVRSGAFFSVVPEIAQADLPAESVHVIRDARLDSLRRPLALAWLPRLADVRPGAAKLTERLAEVLRVTPAAR